MKRKKNFNSSRAQFGFAATNRQSSWAGWKSVLKTFMLSPGRVILTLYRFRYATCIFWWTRTNLVYESHLEAAVVIHRDPALRTR